MACKSCAKETEYSKAFKMAETESKIDKTDYIIYEKDGKIYYDKKTCWEKDGRKGNVKQIIFFV